MKKPSSSDLASQLKRSVPVASTATARADDRARRFEAADKAMGGEPMTSAVPGSRGSPVEAPRLSLVGMPSADVILEVPIEKVHDNDYNARTQYDPEVVKQRASEIAADGQKTPALAVPHPSIPGEYMLVEGHYRKRALMHLRRPRIKLIVRADWQTPQQRFVQSWKANEERLANSPLDNAIQWSRVLAEGVIKSHEELSDLLGVSAPTVSKTLSISALPQAAMDKARAHPEVFTMSMLYELTVLAKALPSEDIPKLMDRIASEGWSRRDLEQHKASLTQASNRKPKETSRQHKILTNGQLIGVIKDWDNGRVLLDVRFEDAASRVKLVEELRERFGLNLENSQLQLR